MLGVCVEKIRISGSILVNLLNEPMFDPPGGWGAAEGQTGGSHQEGTAGEGGVGGQRRRVCQPGGVRQVEARTAQPKSRSLKSKNRWSVSLKWRLYHLLPTTIVTVTETWWFDKGKTSPETSGAKELRFEMIRWLLRTATQIPLLCTLKCHQDTDFRAIRALSRLTFTLICSRTLQCT